MIHQPADVTNNMEIHSPSNLVIVSDPNSFTSNNTTTSTSQIMTMRSQTNSLKSKTPYVGYIKYLFSQVLSTKETFIPHKPTCYTKASKYLYWREIITNEFNALI